MNNLQLIKIIMYFISDSFRTNNQDIHIPDNIFLSDEIINIAHNNKVLYYLCKQIKLHRPDLYNSKLLRINQEGDLNMDYCNDAFKFTCNVLDNSGIDFRVIKTYKNIPYLTADFDICVDSSLYDKAAIELMNAGAKKIGSRIWKFLLITNLGTPDYHIGNINIDLYKELPWVDFPCIDKQKIFSSYREVQIYDQKCKIPNLEYDYLSTIISPLFTDWQLRLIDVLYLHDLVKLGANFNQMKNEASIYGWGGVFENFFNLIENIVKSLYSKNPSENLFFPIKLPPLQSLIAVKGPLSTILSESPEKVFWALTHIWYNAIFGKIYNNIRRFV